MSAIVNAMMGAAGAGGAGGFSVDNSMLLNDGDSEYLRKINTGDSSSNPSNADIGTISVWFKRGDFPSGNNLRIWNHGDGSSPRIELLILGASDKLLVNGGATGISNTTTMVFRDPHAWYNAVLRIDTSQATAADRVRLYINGTLITDYDSTTYPSQNADIFTNSADWRIGSWSGGTGHDWDGYVSEVVYCDSQSLAPTAFGEYSDSGIWRPIDPSSNTFGNQGFYLPFTDSNYLGADYSTGSGVGVAMTTASEWNGDTGDFSTLANDIVATGGNQGAIRTNKTFTGDFAFDFVWKGGSNPAYVGVYEIDEDGTFSTGSSDGGMGSMTDSFYLYFAGSNVVNALKGSSTEASSIFTAASGEVVKFQRSGSQFKVYEDGVLRHTFTGTSSNEVRILIGQSSSSLDWEYFRWVNGSTTLNGGNVGATSGFITVNSPTQTSDSPTNNHCVMSPVFAASTQTLSEGNLKVVGSTSNEGVGSTHTLFDGAYWEIKNTANGSGSGQRFGVASAHKGIHHPSSGHGGGTNGNHTYHVWDQNNTIYQSNNAGAASAGTHSAWSSFTTGDVISFHVDGTNLKVRKNNDSFDTIISSFTATDWLPFIETYNGTVELRFQADDWTQTLPTGAKAVNTTNQYAANAPAIEDGSAYFQATTYTGNGSAREVNQSGNSQFTPDFVWVKKRNGTNEHRLIDAVRGATKTLFSDGTAAESTESTGVTSFDSDGFSVGTGGGYNNSSGTYVGWQWLAGNSTASNSNGSITSTVSVNQTAGFSIVTWTGSGANATIGHGLGAAPKWILIKNRSSSQNWPVYFESIGNDKSVLLDTTGSQAAGMWQNTTATSTVFSVDGSNNVNKSTENMIAYCWAEISSYSKFAVYDGNVSSDGVYIHLGFRPSFFIAKNADSTGAWLMFDSAREPFNLMDLPLEADDSKAEAASGGRELDFLSNGVKLRGNSSYLNSAHTFIYMAFAEHPFAGSTPATAR